MLESGKFGLRCDVQVLEHTPTVGVLETLLRASQGEDVRVLQLRYARDPEFGQQEGYVNAAPFAEKLKAPSYIPQPTLTDREIVDPPLYIPTSIHPAPLVYDHRLEVLSFLAHGGSPERGLDTVQDSFLNGIKQP